MVTVHWNTHTKYIKYDTNNLIIIASAGLMVGSRMSILLDIGI